LKADCISFLCSKVILFGCVAKCEEAHDICARSVRDLACSPSFYANHGKLLNGHRQWILCAIRRPHEEGGTVDGNSRRIPPAAGADDFLLFSHRLQTTHQGKKIYRVGQKSKPANFCNNFVSQFSLFLAHIHYKKFAFGGCI